MIFVFGSSRRFVSTPSRTFSLSSRQRYWTLNFPGTTIRGSRVRSRPETKVLPRSEITWKLFLMTAGNVFGSSKAIVSFKLVRTTTYSFRFSDVNASDILHKQHCRWLIPMNIHQGHPITLFRKKKTGFALFAVRPHRPNQRLSNHLISSTAEYLQA